MVKQAARKPFNTPLETGAKLKQAPSVAEVQPGATGAAPAVASKPRQIHKSGAVNVSAYFPAKVKASLRMVRAKTGYNLEDCPAEALRDLFQKRDAPLSVQLGEGR